MITLCPGCHESFEAEGRIAIADFRSFGLDLQVPIETQHFLAPDGRLFCCDDCFEANG